MDKRCKRPESLRGIIVFVVLLGLVLLATSCGPSWEDRQAKKESKRKELVRKQEVELQKIAGQILEKHNAIYFPPKALQTNAYTYELQKFFQNSEGRSILFRGYLEDIERTDRGTVIEFLCPLGEDFFTDKRAVRVKLSLSDNQVERFIEGKREELVHHSLRYLYEPGYFVVAKIADLRRSRRYEFGGSTHGEEIEINVDMPAGFVATGVLIDAVTIRKDENETGRTR